MRARRPFRGQEKTLAPERPGTSVHARGTTLLPAAHGGHSAERHHAPAPANGGLPSRPTGTARAARSAESSGGIFAPARRAPSHHPGLAVRQHRSYSSPSSPVHPSEAPRRERCQGYAPRRALLALVVLMGMLAAACGGGGDGEVSPGRTPTLAPTTAPDLGTPTAEPPPPAEFKVAFINLQAPISSDANNVLTGETYDDRLEAIIAQLKELNPDLIAFNEASWTREHGSAISRLAKELKMEFFYARANPWYPGQSREQSDGLVKQLGFEEGELVLSRYKILRGETRALNPRTGEPGEQRVALHVVIGVPQPVGEVDVYVTHLTGGGDRTRRAQASDFATWIGATRGKGPTLVMAGSSDPQAESTYDLYPGLGLHEAGYKLQLGTCCRETPIGEQPPLKLRTDYLMAARWTPLTVRLFADQTVSRPDGTVIYASDHNGILAAFPLAGFANPAIPESR